MKLLQDAANPRSGIVSSWLYVTTTILGAMRWEGYSSTSQVGERERLDLQEVRVTHQSIQTNAQGIGGQVGIQTCA